MRIASANCPGGRCCWRSPINWSPALAMTEIDGVARRMLLCPPDLNTDHVQALIEDADIDAIVTDHLSRWTDAGVYLVLGAHSPARARPARRKTLRATEWLMLTSGTSGGAENRRPYPGGADRRDCRGRSGARRSACLGDFSTTSAATAALQIFLRAIIGGGSMVLSEPGEALADHVARLRAARRHAYFRHAVALAQAADERLGVRILAALRSPVRRDCRSGRARWFATGVSRSLGGRRFCRQ